MYQVKVRDEVVKTYPFKLQAIIYCFLNGYVTSGRGWYFLNPYVKINEVENDRN
jgi:hypothetical protein